MSTVSADGIKVVLPRTGPEEFWTLIQNHYAEDDPLKWKYLAMLALRENCGWPLDAIGMVFGHPKGHVSRCLGVIKQELRDHFREEHPQAPHEDGFFDPQ